MWRGRIRRNTSNPMTLRFVGKTSAAKRREDDDDTTTRPADPGKDRHPRGDRTRRGQRRKHKASTDGPTEARQQSTSTAGSNPSGDRTRRGQQRSTGQARTGPHGHHSKAGQHTTKQHEHTRHTAHKTQRGNTPQHNATGRQNPSAAAGTPGGWSQLRPAKMANANSRSPHDWFAPRKA